MADNFTDFYTGNMAPPLRLPGGGYAPAPLAQPQMTPEEIYEGIYGEPLTLSSRSVKTVPVPMSADASARFGAATGMRGSGSATYQPPPLPSVVRDLGVPQYGTPGTGGGVLTSGGLPTSAYVDKRTSERLPSEGAAVAAIDKVAPRYGNYTATPRPAALLPPPSLPSMPEPVHQLNVDVADAEGQMYADNMGMPVRSKSGKVYAPKQAYTPKALSDVRATAPKVTAQRGLLATLLGGLSNAPQQSRGGGLGSLLSGGQVTRAPLAGNPMVVDPGTSAGSTLESMGFSSGAVLPSAVVENLSSRGYI